MRLAISLLGREVFALDLGPALEAADDEDVWVDCGATTSYPVGFVRAEVPWEDGGSLHQFDAPDDE